MKYGAAFNETVQLENPGQLISISATATFQVIMSSPLCSVRDMLSRLYVELLLCPFKVKISGSME